MPEPARPPAESSRSSVEWFDWPLPRRLEPPSPPLAAAPRDDRTASAQGGSAARRPPSSVGGRLTRRGAALPDRRQRTAPTSPSPGRSSPRRDRCATPQLGVE